MADTNLEEKDIATADTTTEVLNVNPTSWLLSYAKFPLGVYIWLSVNVVLRELVGII